MEVGKVKEGLETGVREEGVGVGVEEVEDLQLGGREIQHAKAKECPW